MQAPNGINVCVNPVYTSIPELGMVWMGDMMVHGDPSHELMIDSRQASENSFFTHSSNPFEDIRNNQIASTTMVRYLPQQFTNECSESNQVIKNFENPEIDQDYNHREENEEMREYLTLDDYVEKDDEIDENEEGRKLNNVEDTDEEDDEEEEREMIVSNVATQTTQECRNRKIKPIRHPGLVLKTPIAYQPHTDLNFIPIRKDGIAVCEKCGAIGVKHAFYTKERRFCSRACARSSEHIMSTADSTYVPSYYFDRSTVSLPKEKKLSSNGELIKNNEQEYIEYSCSKENNSNKVIVETAIPEDLPARRKRTADMIGSYDWTPQLIEPGFCAAPVSCFKHAPISELWDNITVGMKVEVENTDCDEVCEAFPDSFWVATVLRISGYRALLRYEGFGHNADKDFWVSLCSNDIYPVGWCATIGKPLIPPNTIANKYKDWKDFLMRRLTGARTLPTNFYNKVNESIKSRFRCGLHLEVVDKNRISQVKVATIQKIVGKRLHVRYYDSSPEDNGFWCHEDSPLIHPVGWAKRVGQTLDAYPEYLQRVAQNCLCSDDATENLFYVPKNYLNLGYSFQKGMKIEAIDPLNLSAICAATIMQVLKENYIMIKIDSYDEDTNGADWFCYNVNSPCIFPVGFCAQNGLPLTPPKGCDPTTFSWNAYLIETNTIPAPIQLFNREIPQHGFVEGMRLEAADLMDPRLVCVATITRVIGRLLRVHFDGWEDEYDQWLDCESPDIYPVGWCDLVNHKLEGPRVLVKNMSQTIKTPKNLKRKTKRKMKKSSKIICVKNILSRHSEQIEILNECNKETEPAQATKIERSHELESLPGQDEREPETAQEPAGPDQTLPTSGQEPLIKQIQQEVQGSTLFPMEINASSYIDVNPVNGKYIPKIADGWQKNYYCVKLVPTEWNVIDVAQFLRINDCVTYCDNFTKRKIDGKSLLALTKDQIIDLTGFKVGPSLKIFDLIQQLKIKVNPAQERLRLSLKKVS